LGRSMTTFGVVEPVVVNRRTGRIVGGHQRVKAAEAQGIAELPVVHVDLDETEERQLNVALNRISGEFDLDKLADLLKELEVTGADLDLTGFTTTEIDDLIRGLETPEDGLTDPDLVPEAPDDPATQPGDLIFLGRHRLLCGDASSCDDLAKLLDGKPVHLVHTDPPYNVNVEPRSNNAIAAAGGSRKHHQGLDLARHPEKTKPTGKMRARDRVLENDFLSDEEFVQMLGTWFKNAASALEPGRGFYFWGGYANVANYPQAIEEAGLFFSQAIIWVKGWPVLTRKDFMGNHEWCFYGWKKGAAHYFNPGINNAPDVWSVKKVNPNSMVHLTEKPSELAERALTYSSRKGETVLDLFGGSGSTLVAAERLGRNACLMEIDPAYCDVIVQRWQDYTGAKADGWRGND
ncbi:MAG: DNA modification methylase, partial [bacterium]|nr:DNA modification methylase [bacterium]